MQQLNELQTNTLAKIHQAQTLQDLEALRLDILGKSGALTALLKGLSTLSGEERSKQGAALNVVKQAIMDALTHKKEILESEALEQQLAKERIDVSLSPNPEEKGGIHPTNKTMEELIHLFLQMGFSVAEGPDIEDDFNNFTALNIPLDHPARQDHDTFYLKGEVNGNPGVLRTHTSPVQIRTMTTQKPPIRIISPGHAFRADYDMTHTPMFHQIEGLVIDRHIHMGHLKHTVLHFLRAYFGLENLSVRFRPSFFPFTEPSAEMDIQCDRSKGSLKLGEGTDWLEVGGGGMVHPNVLRNCGIDPAEYQGFAFGFGLERLTMLKHGIPDLRDFFEADTRWLKHYGFDTFDIPSALYAAKGDK
ncbi:MAG: phenylalanine--tRNA ligase subunit alpha [Alphaproteobacteria bacterium]